MLNKPFVVSPANDQIGFDRLNLENPIKNHHILSRIISIHMHNFDILQPYCSLLLWVFLFGLYRQCIIYSLWLEAMKMVRLVTLNYDQWNCCHFLPLFSVFPFIFHYKGINISKCFAFRAHSMRESIENAAIWISFWMNEALTRIDSLL